MLSPLLAELRILFSVLGDYTWKLVFLIYYDRDCIKGSLSVVYAENSVPHMLSGKVIARAIRAQTLVDCSRYI